GVGLVASVAGLDRELEEADLVITGEGRLDRTSLEGKVVGEVLGRAQALGIPCLVLAGSAEAETVAQVQGRGAVVRITSSQGSGPPLPERAASELASAAAAACLELAGPRAARQ
ncbi:MAG TPA: glycerate kinase, partial [Candidatus Dormibacteraeota bacterium]